MKDRGYKEEEIVTDRFRCFTHDPPFETSDSKEFTDHIHGHRKKLDDQLKRYAEKRKVKS